MKKNKTIVDNYVRSSLVPHLDVRFKKEFTSPVAKRTQQQGAHQIQRPSCEFDNYHPKYFSISIICFATDSLSKIVGSSVQPRAILKKSFPFLITQPFFNFSTFIIFFIKYPHKSRIILVKIFYPNFPVEDIHPFSFNSISYYVKQISLSLFKI